MPRGGLTIDSLILCGLSVSATFIKNLYLLLLKYFYDEVNLFFDIRVLSIRMSSICSPEFS